MASKNELLQILRDQICFRLANQLTYPKALLSIARNRPLTEVETQKASQCFDECIQFVEAELVLFKANSNDRFQ